MDLHLPSKALINKRKLYKPVETSEKEAEDKKKTKEDEEVATSTVLCTSNELVRTSFVKVWYRIRASNNITHRSHPLFDHSPRETPSWRSDERSSSSWRRRKSRRAHPPPAAPARPRRRTKRRRTEWRKKESRKVTEGGQWRRKEEKPPATSTRKFCYPGVRRYDFLIAHRLTTPASVLVAFRSSEYSLNVASLAIVF